MIAGTLVRGNRGTYARDHRVHTCARCGLEWSSSADFELCSSCRFLQAGEAADALAAASPAPCSFPHLSPGTAYRRFGCRCTDRCRPAMAEERRRQRNASREVAA